MSEKLTEKQKKTLESLLDSKLEIITQKLYEIDRKVDDASNSLSFLSNKVDDALNKLKKLEEAKKASDKEIAKLKSNLKVANDNLHMYQAALNDLEQYSRRECLEIGGIPVISQDTSRENTEDIVKQVANCMGVDLCSEDISICHRLPLNNALTQTETRSSYRRQTMNPAIIIKFVRRKKREEFYRAGNILRGKTVNDLNLNFKTGERMFVAKSLTRTNKELFSKAL